MSHTFRLSQQVLIVFQFSWFKSSGYSWLVTKLFWSQIALSYRLEKPDSFTIDQESNTFLLSGEGRTDSTVKYKVKDGTITVDISGIEHEYYQKGSKAYNKALQQYNK